MLLATLLAAALAQPPAPAVDTALVLKRAVAAQQRFLKRWRDEWMESEMDRAPADSRAYYEAQRRLLSRERPEDIRPRTQIAGTEDPRVAALHCHVERSGRGVANRIASANSRHGWCPRWLEKRDRLRADEALAVDSALLPGRRAKVAKARWALLATLDSAAARLPGNALLLGQRVRFLVDAGASDSALALARACGGGARAAACARLAGWVLARRGDVWAADSAFGAARAAMTDAERCAWDDVSNLLDDDALKAYAALSCAEREAPAARLWWVSRPLLGEPANERRVEHYARRVHVELHAVGGFDERHDWEPAHAGDALVKMYERYGVPTYLYWAGQGHETSHDRYLLSQSSPPSAPYTAPEYGTGRQHYVPVWRAVAEPTSARADDWELSPRDPFYPGTWWPREHHGRRGGPLAALPDGQTAMLRRAHGALLAVATSARAPADSSGDGAVLVVSWHPDSLMQVGRGAPRADGRLVLSGPAGTRPALVGVEVAGDARTPPARLRFGLTPPPPLTAMRDGEAAVSEPVLFEAPAAAPPPNDPDAVIARMLPSATLRDRRVGVYWETYGLAPSDTVDVELRVEPADGPGVARRAATALRLADGADGPLAIRWREPRPDRVIQVVEAPRPVVARSVVLDLSRLPGGRYWLEVAVGRPGGQAARARRAVVLD